MLMCSLLQFSSIRECIINEVIDLTFTFKLDFDGSTPLVVVLI